VPAGRRGGGARTFDDLPGLLVDVPPLADDRHHALHLRDIVVGPVRLLESLPDLEQGNTLCRHPSAARGGTCALGTHLALETLALQVPVRAAEHLPRKLGVARRGRRLGVFVLVLALCAQDWDRLGLEERVRDPDLYVPAEGDETLVQRARAFALALFDLEVDVRLPKELGH
jgi:hypothetical protein